MVDTSASVRGDTVKSFLKTTWEILMESGSFFREVNIHIIQCDSQVRDDKIITSQSDLDDYIKGVKLTGFGATDFRPAFAYVDELIAKKTFRNLKGMIYFTDGYGIYPSKGRDYDVIFAFLREDKNRLPVPPWAIEVVISEDN